ncbi:MAG: HAMP domain-containing histidine kinase [Bacteroidetes bacterium]|nr:HAMP domain-containing histidine kinase [Bacteroidota bacterium]
MVPCVEKVWKFLLPEITISTTKTNNTVLISVIDNGEGIPPEYIEKVFEPFFTTKPTGEGVGLGLSISSDIMRAYGGAIVFEKGKDNLTRFVISLPVRS